MQVYVQKNKIIAYTSLLIYVAKLKWESENYGTQIFYVRSAHDNVISLYSLYYKKPDSVVTFFFPLGNVSKCKAIGLETFFKNILWEIKAINFSVSFLYFP